MSSTNSTRCRMKKWPKYLSDEEMTKIKVVDLDEFYNFVVGDFFS
jgi:hypothetical protein